MWADYPNDDTLPIIPWVKLIKPESKQHITEQWVTVKSKKKRK